MVYTFEHLKEAIAKSETNYNLTKIEKAYEIAEKAHDGQRRESGEAYVTHPVAVAIILVELGMDTDSLVAALLHDVVEDTAMTLQELEKMFGKTVASLVDGVTKLGKIPYSTKEEEQAENIRKMLLAMSQDIRVIIIKLADRLHNMRTIDACKPQKRRDKARETMDIFAPIAHRLGIRAVKEELEDISIAHLDPIGYKEIEDALMIKADERNSFLQSIKQKISDRFYAEGKEPYIEGRVKSVFGIYKKMFMQGRAFEEIYDIYAVRIIVDNVFECYNILGIMHDLFTPIPNRFKDYISTPKPNMYQSLHTTVIDKNATPFEIQIRTWDMHHTAEYGIAAHWKYKAGTTGTDSLESRLTWVRKMLEAPVQNPEEIMNTIKSDLGPEEVFVFTPKGDVKILPADSTPIDFAYAIHSAVGNKMVGAKVDGRMVSLDYKLKTGQIVDILTGNSASISPNRDWLKIVKTSEARNKIRAWFKKERREENIAQGKTEFEYELRRNNIRLDEDEMKKFTLDIAKRQRCTTVDEFYAAIGYGGISISKIIPRIKEDYQRIYLNDSKPEPQIIKPRRLNKVSSGVVVEGLGGCLVKFAQCCNPLPGDDIIGFVTRGYGVSVHKRDCVNIENSLKNPEHIDRIVNTHWASDVHENFKTTIEILGNDRAGLLADISIQISNLRIGISELNARDMKDGHACIYVTFNITGIDQLKNVMAAISKIDGVTSVMRSGK